MSDTSVTDAPAPRSRTSLRLGAASAVVAVVAVATVVVVRGDVLPWGDTSPVFASTSFTEVVAEPGHVDAKGVDGPLTVSRMEPGGSISLTFDLVSGSEPVTVASIDSPFPQDLDDDVSVMVWDSSRPADGYSAEVETQPQTVAFGQFTLNPHEKRQVTMQFSLPDCPSRSEPFMVAGPVAVEYSQDGLLSRDGDELVQLSRQVRLASVPWCFGTS